MSELSFYLGSVTDTFQADVEVEVPEEVVTGRVGGQWCGVSLCAAHVAREWFGGDLSEEDVDPLELAEACRDQGKLVSGVSKGVLLVVVVIIRARVSLAQIGLRFLDRRRKLDFLLLTTGRVEYIEHRDRLLARLTLQYGFYRLLREFFDLVRLTFRGGDLL